MPHLLSLVELPPEMPRFSPYGEENTTQLTPGCHLPLGRDLPHRPRTPLHFLAAPRPSACQEPTVLEVSVPTGALGTAWERQVGTVRVRLGDVGGRPSTATEGQGVLDSLKSRHEALKGESYLELSAWSQPRSEGQTWPRWCISRCSHNVRPQRTMAADRRSWPLQD